MYKSLQVCYIISSWFSFPIKSTWIYMKFTWIWHEITWIYMHFTCLVPLVLKNEETLWNHGISMGILGVDVRWGCPPECNGSFPCGPSRCHRGFHPPLKDGCFPWQTLNNNHRVDTTIYDVIKYLCLLLVEFVACLLRYRLMISPSLSTSLIILWTISKILHLNWTLQGHRLQGAHELQTSTRRPAWVGFGEGLAVGRALQIRGNS